MERLLLESIMLTEAHSSRDSSTENMQRQPRPASLPRTDPWMFAHYTSDTRPSHCDVSIAFTLANLRRHTWLMAPDEFGSAPPPEMKSGPLLRSTCSSPTVGHATLRSGFTAPMHMARRARHGEATKAWRRGPLKVETGLSRNARVDDTCWRRPGDATAWRSAACACV